uniref:Phosphoinositide-3-kinase interacting protein 1 n=1 Tax=Gallus gallus TaxID=9031 RepID=A0A8V0ZWY4_CHICK
MGTSPHGPASCFCRVPPRRRRVLPREPAGGLRRRPVPQLAGGAERDRRRAPGSRRGSRQLPEPEWRRRALVLRPRRRRDPRTQNLRDPPLPSILYVSFFLPTDATATTAPVPTAEVNVSQEVNQVFEPADTLPSRSEAAAVQPVIGISQRVQMNSREKKDLGTLGYVLGLIMMVIIIAIGAGIVVGYIYKRGKDLKEKHEQKVYEREMQRITLPLSAFTNPACELVDENTIVVHTNQTPVEDTHDGSGPLMGQAGTPGA